MQIKEITQTIFKEEFYMTEYDMFGWIKPLVDNGVYKAEIVMPSKKDADDPEMEIDHNTLAPSGSYTKACADGWLRWLIKQDTLWVETEALATPELISVMKDGIRKIEEIAGNYKNFYYFKGENARHQSKLKQPLTILYYWVFVKDFSKKSSNLREIFNLLDRKMAETPIQQQNIQSKRKRQDIDDLYEAAHNEATYSDWGIIYPKTGEIVSGMKHPDAVNHIDLIRKTINPKKKWTSAPAKNSKEPARYGVLPGEAKGALYIALSDYSLVGVLKAWKNIPKSENGITVIAFNGDDFEEFSNENKARQYLFGRWEDLKKSKAS